jgi:predicted nuclease with TOPRIM domain
MADPDPDVRANLRATEDNLRAAIERLDALSAAPAIGRDLREGFAGLDARLQELRDEIGALGSALRGLEAVVREQNAELRALRQERRSAGGSGEGR